MENLTQNNSTHWKKN